MNLAMGDELTPGYDPKILNTRHQSKALTKAFNEKTISDARKGASLTLKNKANLLHQLHQFSLPAYDRIFLFYGDNDYLYSKAGVKTIANSLTQAIHFIRHQNRYIKIYGILPLPMYNISTYDKGTKRLTEKRSAAGYTLKDMIQWLHLVYTDNGVPSLNWSLLMNPIVNQHNASKRLIDGHYPTKHTYQLMADRISKFVKQNEIANKGQRPIPVAKDSHPTVPDWAKGQVSSNSSDHVVKFGKLPKSDVNKKINKSNKK